MAFISGPWTAESSVSDDTDERGVAVIAVLPELQRTPQATPTRGMVAWVHSGLGACETDKEAVDTGRLISAAPDLMEALKALIEPFALMPDEVLASYPDVPQPTRVLAARAAIRKAEGTDR